MPLLFQKSEVTYFSLTVTTSDIRTPLSYFFHLFVKNLPGLPPTNQYYVSPQFQVLLRVESSPQVKRKALKRVVARHDLL